MRDVSRTTSSGRIDRTVIPLFEHDLRKKALRFAAR